MKKLLELAARVERGGDEEVDVNESVHLALFDVPSEAKPMWDHDYGHCFFDADECNYICIGDYTRSMDAAQALHAAVLPGWDWEVGRYEGEMIADVWPEGIDNSGRWGAKAHTPAAAWVAAILRAKASEEETE